MDFGDEDDEITGSEQVQDEDDQPGVSQRCFISLSMRSGYILGTDYVFLYLNVNFSV